MLRNGCNVLHFIQLKGNKMSYDYSRIIDGWLNIAYGNGVFVTISRSSNTSARSTDNGVTWTQHDMLN